MSKLLPCPFCAAPAELFVREFTDAEASYGNAAVDCSKCGVGFGLRRDEAEAIAAWNTRSPSFPELVAALEKARRGLSAILGHPATDMGSLSAMAATEAMEAADKALSALKDGFGE